MPHPFPHNYGVRLAWKGGENCEILSAERPVLQGGPPAQFDGTEERWSPEHLVLAALSQCFMLTWIALNKRSQIPLKGWESTGESVLDKTKEGLVFTSFKISVTLKTDAGRVDEAKKLLELAKKHCIIANALKTPATLDAAVEAA